MEVFGDVNTMLAINMIILIKKQFVATQKFTDSTIRYDTLQGSIRKYIEMEKEIAYNKNEVDKPKEKWHTIPSSDMSIAI